MGVSQAVSVTAKAIAVRTWKSRSAIPRATQDTCIFKCKCIAFKNSSRTIRSVRTKPAFSGVPNKNRTEFQLESAFASRGFKLIGLLSLAMLHWAMILAVCPELHELIHHDADDEHHDCAVTAILSGGIEHTPMVPVVAAVPGPALECFVVSFNAQPATSFFLSCCILEHAPPVKA